VQSNARQGTAPIDKIRGWGGGIHTILNKVPQEFLRRAKSFAVKVKGFNRGFLFLSLYLKGKGALSSSSSYQRREPLD